MIWLTIPESYMVFFPGEGQRRTSLSDHHYTVLFARRPEKEAPDAIKVAWQHLVAPLHSDATNIPLYMYGVQLLSQYPLNTRCDSPVSLYGTLSSVGIQSRFLAVQLQAATYRPILCQSFHRRQIP